MTHSYTDASARPRLLRRRWMLALGGIVASFALVACGGNGNDVVDANGNGMGEPTPAGTVPALPTEPPAQPTPPAIDTSDVTEFSGVAETAAFRMTLPDGWLGYDVVGDGPEAVYAKLVETAPHLPMLQDGVMALAGADLWAFSPTEHEQFIANLNVVAAQGPDLPTTAEDILETLVPFYEGEGLTIVESDADLSISGLSAGYVLVDLVDVLGMEVYSVQYVVVGDDALYSMSFAVHADEFEAYESAFEESAESFEEI